MRADGHRSAESYDAERGDDCLRDTTKGDAAPRNRSLGFRFDLFVGSAKRVGDLGFPIPDDEQVRNTDECEDENEGRDL